MSKHPGISEYVNTAHNIGRIGTAIAIAFMLGIPLVLCAIYDIMPSFNQVVVGAMGLLTMYVPSALSEVISFTPMLGSSCYICFITGNVQNLKIPCVLNALDLSGVSQGTDLGDAVSCIGVAVSSMVTMIVVALGVVMLTPLQPILTHPLVKTATSYMLPALFGSLIIGTIFGKKSGDYMIQNKPLAMVPPLIAIILFNYLIHPIKGKEGFALLSCIPLTLMSAYLFFKKGWIKVTPIKKD